MPELSDAHTKQTTLAGRRVAITGGTTGIGRTIAVLLASEGAKVFVCGRNPDHLGDALERIREVGEGDGINVDLARREDVSRFFEAADAYLGGLDVAVINAALAVDGVAETSEDELVYTMATDFTGYMLSAHAATRRMQGGSDIVFIGSMSAVSLSPASTIYAGAKAGVEGFATALRKELASKGIRVGLIEPGLTGADMQLPETQPEKQREMIEAGEMLRAEDIAVSTFHMLTQPRRTVISMMRVEPLVTG
jgi:3-oxoacyl-[acyl-carrier protein] reductase